MSFKTNIFNVTLLLASATITLGNNRMVVAQATPIGGEIYIGFDGDDLSLFDTYTNDYIGVEMRDGKLYAPFGAACKLFYNKEEFSNIVVSVDINTAIKHGRINNGIIFGGSDIHNKMDKFVGWNVQIERYVDTDSCVVKLHRFNQNWVGAYAISRNIRLSKDKVNLTVTVDDGLVIAYLDGLEVLKANCESTNGLVGLRSFYSPVTFDNFCITSLKIPVNKTALSSRITEVENIDRAGWTHASIDRVDEALKNAKDALESNSQAIIDNALSKLNEAMNAVLTEWSEENIEKLLQSANKLLEDKDSYIQNTVASVEFLLEHCKEAIKSGDKDKISYWCTKLESRLQVAVRYSKEV
jgi:hypothetical protein